MSAVRRIRLEGIQWTRGRSAYSTFRPVFDDDEEHDDDENKQNDYPYHNSPWDGRALTS